MNENLQVRLMMHKPRPRVGLLATGHQYYWDQFPRLKSLGLRMYERLKRVLSRHCDLVATDLVDSEAKSRKARERFEKEAIDLLVIFPFGYTPSMNILPATEGVHVPLRILNAHEDTSYDYATADTTQYLHHEGVCCVPELAGALTLHRRRFKVRTGHFADARLIEELSQDFSGAAAAKAFRLVNAGLIGQVYTGMTDMPIDERRFLRATGRMLVRTEVEELLNAYHRVSDQELDAMYGEFRNMFDVDATVTNDHMKLSAQAAVAYDKVVTIHDIGAFGYYWWGDSERVTQLRAQSNLAVSRLAALGRPGVTEGDVKSALAMKVLDLLGAGGIFFEFFAMDFDENFILMGHDGPSNINMASAKPRLQHLKVHHGKSGHGLGIDFEMEHGPVTILNLTHDESGGTFKMIYTIADLVPGPVLNIGNPNARVRLRAPIHEFFDAWCQQGPSHHVALGYGEHSTALETFAEAMGFGLVRV